MPVARPNKEIDLRELASDFTSDPAWKQDIAAIKAVGVMNFKEWGSRRGKLCLTIVPMNGDSVADVEGGTVTIQPLRYTKQSSFVAYEPERPSIPMFRPVYITDLLSTHKVGARISSLSLPAGTITRVRVVAVALYV